MDKKKRNDELCMRYERTGDSVAAIAADAGLTEAATRNILSARGAARRAHLAKRNELIAREIASGRKPAAVAEEFGVSSGWARRLAKGHTEPAGSVRM